MVHMQDNNNTDAENNASRSDDEMQSFNVSITNLLGLHGAIIYSFVRQGLEVTEIIKKCPYLTHDEVRAAIKEVLFFRYIMGF